MKDQNINLKNITALLKVLIVLFIIYEIYRAFNNKLKAEQIKKLTPEEQEQFKKLDEQLTPTERAKIRHPEYYETNETIKNFFSNLFNS